VRSPSCLYGSSAGFPNWSRGFESRLPLHEFDKTPRIWRSEIEVTDGKQFSILSQCQPYKIASIFARTGVNTPETMFPMVPDGGPAF
jgi:hypothetical protein